MSNRNCDLCGYPIQSLILAVLEHSTPVIHFARNLELPIEEAIRLANAPTNLRCAHSFCNSLKQDYTREEWFIRGLDKSIIEPKMITDEELAELRFKMGAGGRIGGRKTQELHPDVYKRNGYLVGKTGKGGKVSGRMAVENGRLASYRTPEHQRKAGAAAGRKSVESGHIKILIAQGFKNVESGHIQALGKNPKYREDKRRGGRTSGRLAVTSGHLDRIRSLPQSILARKITGQMLGRIYGQINGRKNVENGQLAGVRTLEGSSKGGKIGSYTTNHKRWHVAREIVNPNCSLCIAAQAKLNGGQA
jgi:hypothetical protein